MVSFMTIYSVYYYTQIKKLDASIVALAKDLPHTVFGKADWTSKDKNMIWFEGISQSMSLSHKDTGQFPAFVPDEHFASLNAAYTKENLEKFYEELVTKYPNHPPIQFDSIKDGEKVL